MPEDEDEAAWVRRMNAEFSSVHPRYRTRYFLQRTAERLVRVLNSEHITDQQVRPFVEHMIRAANSYLDATKK